MIAACADAIRVSSIAVRISAGRTARKELSMKVRTDTKAGGAAKFDKDQY